MATIERGGLRLVVENYEAFTRQLNAASASVRGFGQQAQQTASMVNASAGEYAGSRVVIEQWSETVDTSAEQAARAEAALRTLSTAMLATGTAAAVLGTAMTLQASRIEELEALLEVTRQNAIYLAEANDDMTKAASLNYAAVQEQVQGIRDLHLSGIVANETVAQLIRYNLDWTKATDLARLAQDAATFAMQDSSQAVDGLIRGITTLQPRVLRTYGIMVNLNEAYRNFADANDLVAKDLTQAQRQQAAFNAVLAQAPSIAGAYEAAMSTASKQVRSLQTDIVNLSEEFGEHLTPAANAAVKSLRGMIQWAIELPDPIQATAVQVSALSTGLLLLAGTALKARSAILSFTGAVTLAQAASKLLSLSVLGPAGLIAAAGAVVTYGLYLRNVEAANKDLAGEILAASSTYDDYIEQLKDMGLETHTLTEEIYNLIKAKKEQDQAFAAREADEAREQVEAYTKALEAEIVSLYAAAGAEEDLVAAQDILLNQIRTEVIPSLTESEREVFSLASSWRELLTELGYGPNVAIDMAREFAALTRALQDTEDATDDVRNATSIEAEAEMKAAELAETAAFKYRGLAGAIAEVAKEAGDVSWFDAFEAGADAMETLTESIDKQGEAWVKYQDKLADAQRDFDRAIDKLNRDHARRMGDILEDLAQVNIDLQNDILEAERETAQERLKLEQDLARDLKDLERELAQDRVELARERQQDLADLEREYNQDRSDALRDLNRDLADLERDLAKEVEEIHADHLQALVELEQDYAQQREDILTDFAQRAQDIEAKYRLEPEEPDFDDLREALLEEYRKIYEDNRVSSMEQQRLMQILAELEKIKAEELAKLEEEKDAQLAVLDDQLEEEKAAQQAAYEEELAAAQAAYEERRDERRRQYAEKLEDLKLELEQERAEIARDYQERYAALTRKHQEERAEILRRHAEALADLDTQLAEEKARLAAAAEENRQRLQERREDEIQSYNDRYSDLVQANKDRTDEIDRQYSRETDKRRTEFGNVVKDYVDHYVDVKTAVETGLNDVIDYALIPGLDRMENETRIRFERIIAMLDQLGLLGYSPAPFFKDMAESWVEGIKAGFDGAAIESNISSVMSGLQMSLDNVLPSQQLALPMGLGTNRVDNSRSSTLNVTAQYQQYQSEASLRDDLSLWNGMMRAWGR